MKQSYRELNVWRKSIDMVTSIYQLTKTFPDDERCGLIAQMRRCAVSIPSNIAEGQARNSSGEFRQFLGVARGSLAELTTQILIAQNLGYVTADDTTLANIE